MAYSNIRGAGVILNELRRLQEEDKTRERGYMEKAGYLPTSVFPMGKLATGDVDESSVIQGKPLPQMKGAGEDWVQFQSLNYP